MPAKKKKEEKKKMPASPDSLVFSMSAFTELLATFLFALVLGSLFLFHPQFIFLKSQFQNSGIHIAQASLLFWARA